MQLILPDTPTNVKKPFLKILINVFDMSAEVQMLENWLSENDKN